MRIKQFLLIFSIMCINLHTYCMSVNEPTDSENELSSDDDQDDEIALARQIKYDQYEQVLSDLHEVSVGELSVEKRPSLLKKLERMVKEGINPNHLSKVNGFFRNFTGLIVCVENDAEPTLKKLLAMGANPDIQDAKGKTALYRAVQYHPLCVPALLKAKASITVAKRSGRTALSAAANNGDEKLTRLLLYVLMTEINKSNAPEIYNAIERAHKGLEDNEDSYNKNIQKMLAQPEKIYKHIKDDSGEIIQEQSSSSSCPSTKDNPPEGQLCRSIAYARHDINENIVVFLRHREMGMYKGRNGLIRSKW